MPEVPSQHEFDALNGRVERLADGVAAVTDQVGTNSNDIANLKDAVSALSQRVDDLEDGSEPPPPPPVEISDATYWVGVDPLSFHVRFSTNVPATHYVALYDTVDELYVSEAESVDGNYQLLHNAFVMPRSRTHGHQIEIHVTTEDEDTDVWVLHVDPLVTPTVPEVVIINEEAAATADGGGHITFDTIDEYGAELFTNGTYDIWNTDDPAESYYHEGLPSNWDGETPPGWTSHGIHWGPHGWLPWTLQPGVMYEYIIRAPKPGYVAAESGGFFTVPGTPPPPPPPSSGDPLYQTDGLRVVHAHDMNELRNAFESAKQEPLVIASHVAEMEPMRVGNARPGTVLEIQTDVRQVGNPGALLRTHDIRNFRVLGNDYTFTGNPVADYGGGFQAGPNSAYVAFADIHGEQFTQAVCGASPGAWSEQRPQDSWMHLLIARCSASDGNPNDNMNNSPSAFGGLCPSNPMPGVSPGSPPAWWIEYIGLIADQLPRGFRDRELTKLAMIAYDLFVERQHGGSLYTDGNALIFDDFLNHQWADHTNPDHTRGYEVRDVPAGLWGLAHKIEGHHLDGAIVRVFSSTGRHIVNDVRGSDWARQLKLRGPEPWRSAAVGSADIYPFRGSRSAVSNLALEGDGTLTGGQSHYSTDSPQNGEEWFDNRYNNVPNGQLGKVEVPPPVGIQAPLRAGLNFTLGEYPTGSSYENNSSINAADSFFDDAAAQGIHILAPELSNIKRLREMAGHLRMPTFPQHNATVYSDRVTLDSLEVLMAFDMACTIENHSWCTGQDPDMSKADWLGQQFASIEARWPGQLRWQPWNEPGGKHLQSTYGPHENFDVTHDAAWIEWHLRVMTPVLNVNPSARFLVNDTNWGQGGRSVETSALAYYGEELQRRAGANAIITGDLHIYGAWTNQIHLLPGLVDAIPFPVRLGETGGYPQGGPSSHLKGENFIAFQTWAATNQLYRFIQDNPGVLSVEGIDWWHAFQSRYSLHMLVERDGRVAPWEIMAGDVLTPGGLLHKEYSGGW